MEDYSAYYMLRVEDLYLVPICLAILYFFAFLMWRKYRDAPERKYIMPALTLRFICAIIYTIVLVYYYGMGDSHNYYQGVLDMHRAVQDDPAVLKEIYTKIGLEKTDQMYSYYYYSSNWAVRYYMLESRNYMVSKIGLPFSLLFNKSFLCISFCISFFSFLGSWRIFKLFHEMYPHLMKKIAYATLFLPSLLFWGVSLLKDPICIGAMGFFLYAVHSVFIKKKKIISSLIVALLSGFLLYHLKAYILFCLIAVFFLWIFLRFREKITERALRKIATFLFVFISAAVGLFAIQGLSALEETSRYSAENIVGTIQQQQNVFSSKTDEGSGSNFTVSNVPVSGAGAVLLVPLGIVNTYFRPFPWDVRSPMMIFSALEALAFLAITYLCFRRVGIGKTFNIIFSDPVICFCFVFSLIFGGIIGVTTPNFGALVRYKLPCISFYAMAFILVMDKSGKFSPSYIFNKRLF